MGSDWVKFFSVKFVSIKGLCGYKSLDFSRAAKGTYFTSNDAEEIPLKVLKSDANYTERTFLREAGIST